MTDRLPDPRHSQDAGTAAAALPDGGGAPHGGDLAAAAARWGTAAAGWTDLSTGINPWPWPWPVPVEQAAPPAELWTRLPASADLARLTAAAASAYGARGPAVVAAVPGTEAAIRLLPRLVPPGRVGVVGPTYGGHAPAWRLAGHAVEPLDALPPTGSGTLPETVIVTHPNNPDGRLQDPDALLALADAQAARGGRLVVDEAFADVVPEHSVAGSAGRAGMIVLRSFGKFYGLAGLRLGFVLADAQMVEAVRTALGPWPVSGPALAIGAAALEDEDWRRRTRTRLAEVAGRLDALLARRGLRAAGGTDLFRLVETPDAPAIAAALGHAGIYVRDFAERPAWLRFGLPPSTEAEARLEAALGLRS